MESCGISGEGNKEGYEEEIRKMETIDKDGKSMRESAKIVAQ